MLCRGERCVKVLAVPGSHDEVEQHHDHDDRRHHNQREHEEGHRTGPPSLTASKRNGTGRRWRGVI